jgi:uroporphyrinogen decarboxylase
MTASPFSVDVQPDQEAFLRCLRREGTPARVHHIELFHDFEVHQEICDRYGLLKDLDSADPNFAVKSAVALHRFLGFDYVRWGLEGMVMPIKVNVAKDTADLAHQGGRGYVDQHSGPITSWEEFEAYPWADPDKATTAGLDWLEKNLPDDMCVIGGLMGHFAEFLSWLMGYETLCMTLYTDPALVRAIADKILELERKQIARLLQYDRVKVLWGSDDMGFRTGTLVSPDTLREYVLPGHKMAARMAHEAGRLYIMHNCGKLDAIMPDLIDDVQIDAKHSFEDTIQRVEEAKALYGARIGVLGGIDVDFLCRASQTQIRARVREALDGCMAGGGYCLGTGNSVANYIPVDNYLAMVDEGRSYMGWKECAAPAAARGAGA